MERKKDRRRHSNSASHEMSFSLIRLSAWDGDTVVPSSPAEALHALQTLCASICQLCSHLLSVAVTNNNKSNENQGENGLFHLPGYSPSLQETRAMKRPGCRSQSKDHAEMLFGGSLPWPALLYSQGDRTQGWHCPQWVRLSHINQQLRNCPTDMPTN